MLDFAKPDNAKVMRTIAGYRQLNDDGQATRLADAVVALAPGQSAAVPIRVTRGSAGGRITLTIQSESNAKARAELALVPAG